MGDAIEKKEKAIMEQNDSTNGVTLYELATLASRIYPEGCISDPKEAIAAAERLLQEAEAAIDRAYQEERTKEYELELAQMPRIDWVSALKQITGQERRDRAVKRFLEWMEHERPGKSKQELETLKRDGINEDDIYMFQHHFMKWLKERKRKKGTQGRRISERDGRLRTDLVRLVARKPRKHG
jgi:hypothetical protein